MMKTKSNSKNYFFYVSYPVINKLINFNDPNDVALVKWMQNNDSCDEFSSAQLQKIRRLLIKAGLYIDLGNGKKHLGKCSKYYIDLSFRIGKSPDLEENFKNMRNGDKNAVRWIEPCDISV